MKLEKTDLFTRYSSLQKLSWYLMYQFGAWVVQIPGGRYLYNSGIRIEL